MYILVFSDHRRDVDLLESIRSLLSGGNCLTKTIIGAFKSDDGI